MLLLIAFWPYSDLSLFSGFLDTSRFKFTHPGRGATDSNRQDDRHSPVSIHAPREGCDSWCHWCGMCPQGFNSRTPGGVRPDADCKNPEVLKFQFTHPGRGATEYKTAYDELHGVSIHAPREGCDARRDTRSIFSIAFQFTHPGRGATLAFDISSFQSGFQFTHPGRGAPSGNGNVSIHAPREGCDFLQKM